ncbi:hypothetical protein MIND_00590300 [Mycena indigotica]|uniref:Uncharacterized protein n=1 Tax=Mycena indigotica TaxID=2126181 RepID=A0A8H6STE1_9AGAR|nr:uncharacterized protein MIND_00590300 [Mycena indigotica]KAF7303610.1 hypothetical protein MIND_00590300 [Mycena indigotica]
MRSISVALLAAAVFVSQALGLGLSTMSVATRTDGTVCDGQVNLDKTVIGKDNNVQVQFATCPQDSFVKTALESRQTAPPPVNVCGNTCNTFCFTPSGGGPDPNDCNVIADALLYNSQNIGPLFTVPSGTNNTVVMQYATCLTFFVNQESVPIEYCRSDWASLVKFIAPNCQATQNAHGGLCLASNQQWFAQVNHS